VEEYALKGTPEVEPLTFLLVESTQEEILRKHRDERDKRFPDQLYFSHQVVSLGDDELTAIEKVTDTNKGQKVSVQVSRNGEAIYTIQVGDSSPIRCLRGLWAYDNHWVLEVAHVTEKRGFQNTVDHDVFGQVIQDGISLNKPHGYQETFGYQLMGGKPFYFFKKRGRLGISYDNQEIMLGYTQIPHYWCCSASALNPRSAENMVAFFAQRGGVWYYVETGVFE